MKRLFNLSYSLMGLGFFMIFTGSVASFVIGLQNDQALVRERMINVNDSFEEFSTEVSLFNDERDVMYKKVFNSLSYDNIVVNDKTVKEKINNYLSMVDEIDKRRKELDSLCDDVYYPDSETNSRCINYKTIYEQVINKTVGDIEYYNKSITDYNVYALTNSLTTVKDVKIEYDYIDYNNDNEYMGKE